MDNNLPTKRPPLIFWIFIIVAIIAAVLGGVYFYMLRTGKLANLFPTPTPIQNIWSAYTTTPPPIGHGTQLYRTSGGVQGLPTISEVILDPEDPEVGSNQSIIVKANYTSPIKGVEVVLHTDDYKDTTYPLQLSSGTPTDGEWKGTWKVENSYNYIYRVTVKVKNEQNLVQSATVTLR
ncbi:hypothetical protein MUP46_03105 [Patescibacteria group bacterium]|nr:hypothetical protein [Patescibacteria group bacterium]